MKQIAIVALLVIAQASIASAKEAAVPLHLSPADASNAEIGGRSNQHTPLSSGQDTVRYGDVGEDGFAILGDIWDWDEPEGSDPLMGWYATDLTQDDGTYGRHITAAIWDEHANEVPAPILAGTGSLWIGAFEDRGDSLCWMEGLGYGNDWNQRMLSPAIPLSSQQDVGLDFHYFSDTEVNFDYTHVILRRLPSGVETTLSSLSGKVGLATPETDPPVGTDFESTIPLQVLQGATGFQIIFEMTSDGGWSDEDGIYPTFYGPFGVDELQLSGGATASYDFDLDAAGWTFEPVPGVGTHFGIGNVADYEILDPCGCGLSGNLLKFHDDLGTHPEGQHVAARSNPTDVLDMRANLPTTPTQLQIIAEWDQYVIMPRANGVFLRGGWDYYPAICHRTGAPRWSGRVGGTTFYYIAGPECEHSRFTSISNGVPQDAEQIRFVYEVYSSCDAFGITDCTGETNSTPIIDNVQLLGLKVPAGPVISFAPGATTTRFQDGFAQNTIVPNPNGLGRADISYAGVPGDQQPIILGDSLYVTGPTSTPSSMWETRLWFKVRREGPGTKPARYNDWKLDVASINGNPNPRLGFAYAWMDSVETGSGAAFRNQFLSFCREDNLYPGEGGELTQGNEIIRDDVLVAGTAIDYFVTSNYIGTPDLSYYLPDTSGGFFFEFEILPSWRLDGGTHKFPCLLYVDASDSRSAETLIDSAFESLGLEHDRYDYNDAASNWAGPLARGVPPSNNGVPLLQLLGYRGILVNTGSAHAPMRPADFVMLYDWLRTNFCGGNFGRQGLILNGDNIASNLESQFPLFLNNVTGATMIQDAYHESGDENYCVQLETPLGGGHEYGTTNSQNPGGYDYDAWGNWCPQQFRFDVLGASNGGVGNRAYVSVDGGETNYAQIARESIGPGSGNYRVVLDGISYHHLSARDAIEECIADSAHIVDAAANELAAALEWIYGAATIPSLCIQPCEGDASDVEGLEITEGKVTRLYQNTPNPFNPRTVLRFSLGQSGPVELTIFDVNGRKVRTLVNETRDAGLHEVVWDGSDDAGHPVSSGVFWSQLETEGFKSNRKMVVLK